MSFFLTFLIVLATAAAVAMVSVRKFFMTNDAAGYVFVAINWALLFAAAALFALILRLIGSFLFGA